MGCGDDNLSETGYTTKWFRTTYVYSYGVQFHEKMGYKHAGELKDCGYKFNRWYALLYMDKQIGIPQEEMPPIRDFDEVREKFGL